MHNLRLNNRIPAIVVGACAHGLHLIRNFSRHGVPVIVVESNVSQSSYLTRYGQKIKCEDINSDALVGTLLEIYKKYRMIMPLFLTNDKTLETVVTHWDYLNSFFSFPFEKSLISSLKEKNSLHRIALNNGFKLPKSYVISSDDDLTLIHDDLHYPVIMKPSMPMGSFKTKICENWNDVVSQLNKSHGEVLIVQEWIPGDERTLYFCGYYIDRKGQCVSSFCGRKLLCYPDASGNSGSAEHFNSTQLMESGRDFFRDVGYWGLCSIEYKAPEIDSPYFIEVTVGRTDWWLMCSTINGANFPMAAYNDLTGSKIPFNKITSRKYVWQMTERALPVLVEKVVNRKWSFKEFLVYLKRRKKYAYFDLRDMKPFIFASFAFIKRFVNSLVNKLIIRS